MNDELVEQFARYLFEDGKRPKTIQSYIGDVSGFLAYIRQMGTEFIGDIKRFHVTSYRNHLLENNYLPTTINKKINSLRAFNLWLADQGHTLEVVIDLKKDRVKVASGSEKQVEVYTEKQVERLLFYIQSGNVSLRDKAIVLTFLYTGIRVSELCELKLKNIDLLTHCITINGKGNKIREVPLKAEVAEAIKEYLLERAKTSHTVCEPLFLGQRGPLQRDAVNTLLERLTVKFGMDIRLKPHTFRHTFCTRLVKKGIPLTVVSKLAGHSSVETTVRFYVNSSKEDKMQAVNLL